MKTRALILATLLLGALPAALHAQATGITSGGTLPATCIEGRNLYYKTGASEGLYICSDTNTWTIVATGTGSGAPSDAQYVTLTTNGTLANERTLTGTSNQVTVTDNGAGGTVVLSTPQNLHTSATPQFARVGFGTAADSSAVGKFSGQYWSVLVDDGNSGTSDTIDWDAGNEHLSTLTGNVTYTFSNPKDGGRYVLVLATGSGGYTVTWPASVLWPAGAAPTITATASKVDVCTFIYVSSTSKYYGACSQNY